MKASNAFVSTSAFEGQPNAVLEAMGCGCPLVVSDIPAHREFLGPETAAIVPLVNEEFVSAILQTLRGTPDTLRRAEEAKRQIERHDPASGALAYEMIYRQAALRHNRCVA
jgi:glycosyltransferase involved in cell wall biosynthesis